MNAIVSAKRSWILFYFLIVCFNQEQLNAYSFNQESLDTILFYAVCFNQEQLNAIVSAKSSWILFIFTVLLQPRAVGCICFNQELLNMISLAKSSWIWSLVPPWVSAYNEEQSNNYFVTNSSHRSTVSQEQLNMILWNPFICISSEKSRTFLSACTFMIKE